MRQLKRTWNRDRKGYTLLSQMKGADVIMLKTDVIFGQDTKEMIAEFRFDLFNANSQLFERI